MKIEKLNHSKFKVLLYTLILGVVLIFVIIFQTSKAAYRTTQSINIAHGSISYSSGDLNILAVKVQNDTSSTDESNYTSSNSVPTGSYELNTTKSYCTYSNNGETTNINTNMSYDSETGIVNLDITKKGTKCYLYFDIKPVEVSDIVAGATAGSTSITDVATTNEGIKSLSDGMYGGTTYYYRGAVNNNWVNFAGMYWRIIRFNGDGSIRMIYSGATAPTSSTATVMTGTGTQTTTSTFNSSYQDNMYVGWKYTSGQVHGNGTDSTMRDYLVGSNGVSGWYSSSGLSSYSSYLADGQFCNDRYPSTSYSSSNGSGGTGQWFTYFGPYIRAYASSRTATTGCTDSSDIFTEKVGLITMDEVELAGGKAGTGNSSYYLYTNQAYWTMSPSKYNGSAEGSLLFAVETGGGLGHYSVNRTYDVRPVINLKAGTKFTGSGTYNSPYEIAS